MQRLIVSILAPTCAVALTALTAPATAESGRAIVQARCAGCHAVGRTDASPHPGAPPLRRIGDTYNLDDFARLLRTGRLVAPHPDMAAFVRPRQRAGDHQLSALDPGIGAARSRWRVGPARIRSSVRARASGDTVLQRGLPGGGSPDRLDALVWAVTELLEPQRPEPRIRFL